MSENVLFISPFPASNLMLAPKYLSILHYFLKINWKPLLLFEEIFQFKDFQPKFRRFVFKSSSWWYLVYFYPTNIWHSLQQIQIILHGLSFIENLFLLDFSLEYFSLILSALSFCSLVYWKIAELSLFSIVSCKCKTTLTPSQIDETKLLVRIYDYANIYRY